MIGAGGTAGHVVPALAVADALRAEGAEVTFVGGERAEAQLVPAAGYELRSAAWSCRCPRRRPAQAMRRGRGRRPAPCRDARRCSGELRPAAVLGAGGYVAGPVGLAAVLAADSAGADRGRQPSRADQPAAGAVRAAGLPGVSDRGPRRRPLPGHRAAGAAAGHRPRRPRGRASGSACDETCVLVFGGSQGARSINQRRGRGVRRRALPRAPRRRRARLRARTCRRPGPHYDLRGYISRLRRGAAGVRPRGGARRRLDLRDRRARQAGGAGPVPVRHRRPSDRQRALHGAGRRGGRDPRRRADAGAGSPRRSGGCWPTAGGWRRWRARRRRWRGRTRRREIAHEVLAAARER